MINWEENNWLLSRVCKHIQFRRNNQNQELFLIQNHISKNNNKHRLNFIKKKPKENIKLEIMLKYKLNNK
jgi:hypothetical protein